MWRQRARAWIERKSRVHLKQSTTTRRLSRAGQWYPLRLYSIFHGRVYWDLEYKSDEPRNPGCLRARDLLCGHSASRAEERFTREPITTITLH